jgi:hypothetical protein
MAMPCHPQPIGNFRPDANLHRHKTSGYYFAWLRGRGNLNDISSEHAVSYRLRSLEIDREMPETNNPVKPHFAEASLWSKREGHQYLKKIYDIQSVVQVGLSSDIVPISNFMVKLALVELSRGLHSGIMSLEEDLLADFYIWANRRDGIYKEWSKLEYNFNKPSILRWYGAKVERDPNCMVCGV